MSFEMTVNGNFRLESVSAGRAKIVRGPGYLDELRRQHLLQTGLEIICCNAVHEIKLKYPPLYEPESQTYSGYLVESPKNPPALNNASTRLLLQKSLIEYWKSVNRRLRDSHFTIFMTMLANLSRPPRIESYSFCTKNLDGRPRRPTFGGSFVRTCAVYVRGSSQKGTYRDLFCTKSYTAYESVLSEVLFEAARPAKEITTNSILR
ncbi:hypothetical protein FB446DRAFT_156210 [Lentinula raphanica]|nr:hypothetical protein FB446DRAFT_156210 [Lentinula raphanica]